MGTPSNREGLDSTPYRGSRNLQSLIPPDRRRLHALLLVLLGATLSGVALVATIELSGWMRGGEPSSSSAATTPKPPFAVPPPPDLRLGRLSLSGPTGTVQLPQRTPVVVNAWVAERPDCMDGFRASAALAASGGLHLSVPIINVAYGRADPSWARTWGVGENLVFDPDGSAIFKPLGVETFTTYVIAPNGEVRYTDRPDAPGYALRIQRVVAEMSR